MKIIKYIPFFFTAFLLVACKADFFDSITEIEIPAHQSQLVIAADFDATFSQSQFGNWMKVNHSLGILDTASYTIIRDAKVELYEEAVLKNTFEYIPDIYNGREINQRYHTGSLDILPGRKYTLKVSSPVYGNVEASQELPTKVTAIAGTYEADNVVDRYGDRMDEVTFTFKDPEGEKNYYSISVNATYQFENSDTSFVIDNYGVYITPVDPILEEFDYAGLYFTDASFDGQEYTLRIGADVMETIYYQNSNLPDQVKSGPPEKITIRLTSISKDKYLFEKTFSAYQDNDGNPFAEPVVVHENITDGTGIFSLSVTDEFVIDF